MGKQLFHNLVKLIKLVVPLSLNGTAIFEARNYITFAALTFVPSLYIRDKGVQVHKKGVIFYNDDYYTN